MGSCAALTVGPSFAKATGGQAAIAERAGVEGRARSPSAPGLFGDGAAEIKFDGRDLSFNGYQASAVKNPDQSAPPEQFLFRRVIASPGF